MMKARTHLLPLIGFCWIITSGLQAQTASKVEKEGLPQSAQAELDRKYSKYKINNVVKKEDGKNKTTYELELQKKNKLVYLVYNQQGSLVSKRKSKTYTFDGTEPVKKTPPSHDGHNHTH